MLRVASGANAGDHQAFNTPESAFLIDTPSFCGQMYFRLRGVEEDAASREYFSGKKRMLSAVVQGRVKQPIAMGDCFTGYEFERPFANLPTRLMGAALAVIRRLAPTLIEDILGARPYILNPLFQTIQILHVAPPGDEPPLTSPSLAECTHLLGGVFADKSVSRLERKKYFASPSNGAAHTLQPGLVYTMEFYEDKLDPASFELALLGMRFGLSSYLAGQPLQIMGKLGSTPHTSNYLFNIELWHENLLAGTQKVRARAASSKQQQQQQQSSSEMETVRAAMVSPPEAVVPPPAKAVDRGRMRDVAGSLAGRIAAARRARQALRLAPPQAIAAQETKPKCAETASAVATTSNGIVLAVAAEVRPLTPPTGFEIPSDVVDVDAERGCASEDAPWWQPMVEAMTIK